MGYQYSYNMDELFLKEKAISQEERVYLSTSGSTPRDINTSMIFFITAPCRHG